jgi:hypothetical protein
LPSQLTIVSITNHDKFNYVSAIGQNDIAINFVTAIWQNSSNQLCYSYLAEQKSKFPTKGCNTTIHFVTAIWQKGSWTIDCNTTISFVTAIWQNGTDCC